MASRNRKEASGAEVKQEETDTSWKNPPVPKPLNSRWAGESWDTGMGGEMGPGKVFTSFFHLTIFPVPGTEP